MATFDHATLHEEWETYQLFRYGPVGLFYDSKVLEAAIRHLMARDYSIHEFDCERYEQAGQYNLAGLFNAVLLKLGVLREEYPNINAVQFWDLLSEAEVPHQNGLILVFRRFDAFHRSSPALAQDVLEIVARYHY